jgi:hypothetical protein
MSPGLPKRVIQGFFIFRALPAMNDIGNISAEMPSVRGQGVAPRGRRDETSSTASN